MSHFDVVVVGGGPAGCATAIHCAQKGLRVVLLEKARFPRDRPGETLHPGVEPLLRQLGITLQDHRRHPGHWVHWDGPSRFQAFSTSRDEQWKGFQIPRVLLDQQLLEQARTLGVHIVQPGHPSQVLLEQSRVQGVQANATQWTGQFVVDATGHHAWLQRQLQIPWRRFSPRLVARYGYCEDSSLQDKKLGLFAHPDGWHWIARISQTCLHWTQLAFAQDVPHRLTPEALEPLRMIGRVRGADVSWRLCRTTAGSGYFLVGDAAATLDPCASHGVIKALLSGMQAASAIVDCLSWPTGEKTVQAAYQAWVQTAVERDVLALRSFYRAHPYPPAWL
ncbi:FAD-dependent oxidoreductase [Pseudomonas sp. GL93]|uniref:NAD(P)/FAD-dependent oxidoreductase n=1 Tax=Pseudomonas sp. GL93 TaxID=2014741 RepID=UPI000E30F874|nr:FAD-dependent oxidoreductase [Pseudomonas sp. GL93]RFD27402.1 FAD-dependent oxidoreductase [Pseudomonas sp. GL93]